MIAVILALVMIMTNMGLTQVYGATKKPAKPKIVSLKSTAADSFKVVSNKNSKVSGYQIKYSTKKDFSNSKKVLVKGKKLSKTVKGLKGGKKYYVRIRSYKVSKGKKIYSKWSAWKSVAVIKGYSTGSDSDSESGAESKTGSIYLTLVTTNVYTRADASAPKKTLWYDTKLTLLSSRTSSEGTWYKVKYKGKAYYLWDKTKNPEKFTFKNPVKSEAEYLKGCSTNEQKKILKKAFDIYNNWETAYDFDSSYSGGLEKKNGKYLFHCAGFASYVINSVTDLTLSTKPDVLSDMGKKVCGPKIELKKLKPGDILCFKVMEKDSRSIDHVGIYIGNGQFIQSSRITKGLYLNSGYDPDGGVCIAPLDGMYKEGFKKAIRVLD